MFIGDDAWGACCQFALGSWWVVISSVRIGGPVLWVVQRVESIALSYRMAHSGIVARKLFEYE